MDDELRDLERAVQANPDDARAAARLLAARARQRGSTTFEHGVSHALQHFEVLRREVALAVAHVLRNLQNQNWGVRVRVCDAPIVHVTARCFWLHVDERWDGVKPIRYDVQLSRTEPSMRSSLPVEARVALYELPNQDGDQVRAWYDALISDDGQRDARWRSITDRFFAASQVALHVREPGDGTTIVRTEVVNP